MKILTITGIRPDFIRMSKIFKKFDENFEHILVHTGQHYDKMLSDVFFEELQIRKPDYNLEIGGPGKEHFHQTADLSVKIIELIRNENLNPDLICFLGDSNSVTSAVALKKEGYKIAHIEAGMRSYDKRMLEEINRIICDHCSDYLFVYHGNYKVKAINENISPEQIFVVGNTIVEVVRATKDIVTYYPKENSHILLDIHRPENFNDKERLKNIILYANAMHYIYNIPVKMLSFGRTEAKLLEWKINLDKIEILPLMSHNGYLTSVHHSLFMISDSGTAQEEPALFYTPVIVPRDFTERPESVENGCSYMIDVNTFSNPTWIGSMQYLTGIKNGSIRIETDWLGDGHTSQLIVEKIRELFKGDFDE
jgi:UDP-N-acetylglucosamine 2-epimerase (non-hydrolysing)